MLQLEKNIFIFLNELEKFDYKIESIDHIWEIIFQDKKTKWHYLYVTKYNDTFYLSLVDGELSSLEVQPGKSIQILDSMRRSHFVRSSDELSRQWNDLIISAHAWLKYVEKNWIIANKNVYENYPLNRRFGVVPNSLIRASLDDFYRIDKVLGKTKTNKFIRLVESDYFHGDKNCTKESMTANDFFNYCKVAYIASQEKDDSIDESLSGKEMYKRYADGRHEGLLEIDADSQQEFADWIDGKHAKKTTGGHPWEIKRGGNTTHIDLTVYRPNYYLKEGFKIELRGKSIGRLKETICMFLGIYDAGLPITIDNPEGIRMRLLGQDNIGIIPCYDSLHRANQHFSEEKAVFDVLHFDDLGRYKTRIKQFVIWESLPILKIRNVY